MGTGLDPGSGSGKTLPTIHRARPIPARDISKIGRLQPETPASGKEASHSPPAEHPSSPGKKTAKARGIYRSLATGLDPQSINMTAPATPVIEKTVMSTDRTYKLSVLLITPRDFLNPHHPP
ncbi:hypothetical protein TNIN_16941 [Trichonephila inaurata madagascariensis]|uniref:Uncharacterized protein n=1 Tax=Trichonephila inaurata madagascariensis TaxID=2747483 RepID=A0A8X6X9J1_9ARAC|nr:hypothetical protein TNIN_16941 [Trichonephila inaurata madagascariensis]